MKLRELFTHKTSRNDHGFNMLELIMVVVVIGILGGIGFAIYRGISDEARGTVLDTNIQTAAEELTGLLEVNPLAAASDEALAAAMTDRTNFVWDSSWQYGPDDGPDLIRFEMLEKDSTATPAASGSPPKVNWITATDGAAIRIHARNSEGQWRCALVIRHVSRGVLQKSASDTDLKTAYNTLTAAAATSPPPTAAALAAAEIGGAWFDGGNTIIPSANPGLHDCSPIARTSTASGCDVSTASGDSDFCLPETANVWNIPDREANVDPTSTASTFTQTSRRMRTLHGSVGQLDSPS